MTTQPTQPMPKTFGRLLAAELADLVGGLPRTDRLILLLRYADDLTDAETAEVLGLPLEQVRRAARAAVATLRRQLRSSRHTAGNR